MIIKKTKNAVKGVVAGFISKIVSILFPFVIRTVILIKLGEQYIGLSGLFSAVLNVLNLAELGFSTAIVFSMYKPIAEDDITTIKALLNAYRKIYRAIAIIVLIAGLSVMPFLKYLIKGGYPADINLYSLFAIYLANTVLGYSLFAYKSALLTAHQRMDVQSNVQSVINILMYLVQIIVLFTFKNYYIYAVVIPICTLMQNIVIGFISKKMYPQYICEGEIDSKLKTTIKTKVSALIVHKVGSVIQSSIDTICISAFLGITICSRYNNYMYICTAIQGFVTIIFHSIVAGLGNYIHKESIDSNYLLFKRIFFVNSIIVSFCSTCLIVLYQPFVTIWSIKTLHNSSMLLDFSVVIALVLLFFINNIRSACGTYKDALGLWDHDKIRPLAISAFNLVGTIISAYFGSLLWIILSTVGAYLFVSLYWETKVLFKYYFKRPCNEYFYKMTLYFVVCVIVSVISYFICNLIPIDWIVGFIIKAIVCAIVSGILLMLIYCKTEESKFCLEKVGRLKMFSKFKSLVKSYGVFHIQNQVLWELNKNYKTYKKLKTKYKNDFHSKYEKPNDAKLTHKIWFCWLQGIDNAPELVKKCYQSLVKNLIGYEIVVINAENLHQYVDIPEIIIQKWKKKVISNTHFSDILRIALLAKWGGVWVDSTVLCTGKMPEYIEHNDFFVFSNEFRNDESILLSSWLISATPNHPIVLTTRDILYKYWKKENKLCHYFLLHIIMTLVMKENNSLIESMPFISTINPHTLQFKYLFKRPDDEDIKHIKNLSVFHKLSYKFDKKQTEKENTNYQLIING